MPLPFGLKLKRTRRYTVSSKSCLVARIQLLNNEFVEFTLSVESTGQESLEAVAQRLELREVSCKGAAGLWPGLVPYLPATLTHLLVAMCVPCWAFKTCPWL